MADNSLSGIFQKAMSSVTRIAHAPALLFRQLVEVMIDSLSNMSEYLSEKIAESGITDINMDGTVTASSSRSTTNTSTGTSNYIRQDGSIIQSTTIGSTSVNNSTSNSRASKGSNGKKKGIISRIFDKVFGRGTTEAQYGMGYSKQIDPLISSIRYNSCGDSDYQTIGNSGCGPAAAVNAMEAMYGRGSENIVSAARYAIRRGYKEKNGGTTPRFFKDYFSKNGYSSQTTSSKSQLMKNIRSGHPTVLMGKDSGGTSRNTPYGKSPHYVTATGIDRKGHVIIQDPESKYDNQLYSMKDVMRKTSFGVSAFGKSYGTGKGSNQYMYNKYGRGKFGRGSKKIIFVGDSRFVQMYNYRFKGSKSSYIGVTDDDGNIWSVCAGKGLDWMKSTGIPKIESEIDDNTALCINMGINGIRDNSVDSTIDAYVKYYNSKIDDWTSKGAEVYFVSVNPVGSAGKSDNYNGSIHNSSVKKFNKGVKSGVSSKMGYIDTYNAIIDTYKSSDNLHYDANTSDAIYSAIVSSVGSGSSSSISEDSTTSAVAGNNSGGNRRNARVLHIDAEYSDPNRSIASSISNYLAENVSYDYNDSSYVGNMGASSSSSSSSSSDDSSSSKDTSAKGTIAASSIKSNATNINRMLANSKKAAKTRQWGKGNGKYKPMAKYGTGSFGLGAKYGRGVTIIEGKPCYDADDPLSILEGQYQQITLNGKKVIVLRPPHDPFEPNSVYHRELQSLISKALNCKTAKNRDYCMKKAFAYIVQHKDKIIDSYKSTADYRNFALRYGIKDDTTNKNTTTNDDEDDEETEDMADSSSSSSSSDSSSSDVAGDTIGSFLSNVLADSPLGQVLNSFISFSNGSSSSDDSSSGSSSGSSGVTVDGDDARSQTWNYFIKKGYSKAATAGIMGNIENEVNKKSSGSFPGDGDAVGTTEWKWGEDGTGTSPFAGDAGGSGLIQWTPWTAVLGPFSKKKTGDAKAWMTDIGVQLACIDEEDMKIIGKGGSYSLSGAGLTKNLVADREEFMKMDDPEKAARQFQAGVERPNNAVAHTDRRIKSAKWFYDNMGSTVKSSSSKSSSSSKDKDDSSSGKGTSIFGIPGGLGTYGQGDTTNSMVWWYLKQMGMTDEGAAGVMGNMEAESNINPKNLQDSYETSLGYTDDSYTEAVDNGKYKNFANDSAGYGLVQFTSSNLKQDLYDHVKEENKSIGSLSGQLETLNKQLTNSYSSLLSKLKSTKSVSEAASAFMLNYERPADQSSSAQSGRANRAKNYYDKFKGTEGTKLDDAKVDFGDSSSSDSSSSDDSSSSGDTIGSFLSNVLADSPLGQVLNSFISFSNGSSSDGGSSGGSNSNGSVSGSASDIVKIAAGEIGKEKGMNNKYNKWYYGSDKAAHWCAAFVSWCADQAGISTDIIPKDAYTVTMDQKIREKGKRVDKSEARPGDIIFYSHSGSESGIFHVGIVESRNNDKLTTIEGNTGYHDGVTGETERHTDITESSYGAKFLIARPAYSSSSTKSTSKSKETDDEATEDTSGSGTLFGMGVQEDKPLAKYGTFKESIYGKGSEEYPTPIHVNLQDVRKRIHSKEGTAYVQYSGVDRELGRIMKSASRPTVHTKTYGLGTSEEVNVQPTAVFNNSRVVDNSALISTIIKILYTIADNTDKLNTIVAITATSKLNSYADSVGDASLNTIIQAMNAIAAE